MHILFVVVVLLVIIMLLFLLLLFITILLFLLSSTDFSLFPLQCLALSCDYTCIHVLLLFIRYITISIFMTIYNPSLY